MSSGLIGGALLTLWLAQATFSARTDVVVLPVRVVDARGRPIAGLTRNDFRVFDEGRLQTLTTFASGPVPVTLGLAVDHSVSMWFKLPAVLAALDAFARTAQPDDELFALWFNDEVSAQPPGGQPFTRDASRLPAVFSQATAAGATALYDGVIEGLRRLQPGRWDRKALIVISDGGDNASQHTLEELTAVAQRTNAVVYAVGLAEKRRDRRAEKILTQIATGSGGMAYFAESLSDVEGLLAQIGRDLHEQYTLGFLPDARGPSRKPHRVKVTVSAPGAGSIAVRTRSWYLPYSPDR